MVNQTTFGRRTNLPRQALRAADRLAPLPPGTKSAFAEVAIDRPSVALADIASPRVDRELLEWQQARKQRSKMPWRQLALMASLCFGIASFLLPDSVNENLDWLLYALMAASLYAGLSRRWRS